MSVEHQSPEDDQPIGPPRSPSEQWLGHLSLVANNDTTPESSEADAPELDWSEDKKASLREIFRNGDEDATALARSEIANLLGVYAPFRPGVLSSESDVLPHGQWVALALVSGYGLVEGEGILSISELSQKLEHEQSAEALVTHALRRLIARAKKDPAPAPQAAEATELAPPFEFDPNFAASLLPIVRHLASFPYKDEDEDEEGRMHELLALHFAGGAENLGSRRLADGTRVVGSCVRAARQAAKKWEEDARVVDPRILVSEADKELIVSLLTNDVSRDALTVGKILQNRRAVNPAATQQELQRDIGNALARAARYRNWLLALKEKRAGQTGGSGAAKD